MSKLIDLEITVRLTVPRATTVLDLRNYYNGDPLQCAKELLATGGLEGSTDGTYEVLTAIVKES